MSAKQSILRLARLIGLFGLSRYLTRKQLRILCYHGIWLGRPPHYGDCLFMDRSTFARRMALLKRLGYPVLALEDAVKALADGRLPPAAVVITIDDAWYGTYTDMVPALRQYGFPATLYVTTYYVTRAMPVLNVLVGFMVQRASALPAAEALFVAGAGTSWSESDRDACARALSAYLDGLPTLEVRWQEMERFAPAFGLDLKGLFDRRVFHLMSEDELRAAWRQGVDIQLHTHYHSMHDFEAPEVERELTLNREHLARILEHDDGRSPTRTPPRFAHFCYPSGVYDARVFRTLCANGISSATTTEFGLNERGTNPHALKRILDCESLSELELEARLCGFWSIAQAAREWLGRRG